MASATWKVDGNYDPSLAEAFAVYKTLELAKDCSFRNIIVESDCEKIIKLINNGKEASGI